MKRSKKAEKTEPGTPGAKGKYRVDIAKKAYKLSLLGLTDAEMIDFFGIAEQTWYNWQAKHPKLVEAIKQGKTDADSEVAYALYRKACGYSHPDIHIMANKISEYDEQGNLIRTYTEPLMIDVIKHYPPDTGAACFWLKNRSRKRNEPWLEIARTELTGKDGTPIQTQNANLNINELDLSDLSEAELKMLETLGMKINKPAKQD